MSIFILLDSKTNYTGFLLPVPGWKPRQAALPSAGSGRTTQLINLHVCRLAGRIAGLSPSLLQEHLQGELSEARAHCLAHLPVERVVYYPNLRLGPVL